MKPKKQPNGAMKLPKPAVMYVHPWSLQRGTRTPPSIHHKAVIAGGLRHDVPCLVLPLPTKRAALAKKKWEGLSYVEKVDELMRLYSGFDPKVHTGYTWARYKQKYSLPHCHAIARAILALTGEPSP